MNPITVCRVEAFETPGAHLPMKLWLPVRPDASRPPARPLPVDGPGVAKVVANPAQVPPEAPLPMQAQPFEFIGIRDIVGFLVPACRPRAQAVPAEARSLMSPRRPRTDLR